MWSVSGTPSRKTAVTSSAGFAGNGFHTSLPSHCLTASGSLPRGCGKRALRGIRSTGVYSTWPSQSNLCSVTSSSVEVTMSYDIQWSPNDINKKRNTVQRIDPWNMEKRRPIPGAAAVDPSVPPPSMQSARLVTVHTCPQLKNAGASSEVVVCERSVCDLGTQESTSSFAWLSKSSFIAGMSGLYLKVFDLSDPSKPCQVVPTRAVNGLTVDPSCNTRLASFFESQVSIWKLDSLEKPVYTFNYSSPVLQVKWSPVREGWLGVLLEDSFSVALYDTYPMYLQSVEESEQVMFERLVFPSGGPNTAVMSFSWHPTIPDCLITLDRDGCLDVAQLVERTTITWSTENELTWTYRGHWTTCGPNGIKSSRPPEPNSNSTQQSEKIAFEYSAYAQSEDPDPVTASHTPANLTLGPYVMNDIAHVMRFRAESGYGTAKDISSYIGLSGDATQLRTLWVWIKYIQDYFPEFGARYRSETDCGSAGRSNGFKESTLRARSFLRYAGALAILSGECSPSGTPTPSEVLSCSDWEGLDTQLPFPRYRSPERSHVLRLCMWRLDDTVDVQRRVFESVCAEGEYGRAATMALINLKFNWALSFLNRASTALHLPPSGPSVSRHVRSETLANEEIGLVALALAGFTGSQNELWRATCANMLSRLENSYLRVMFTFLTRQGGDFDPILKSEDLRLSDRLAFACLYLNDTELLTFVRSSCERMIQAGRLEAVLLTGISSTEFVSLIQSYVDVTGDVQTAAIVGLQACQMCISSASHGATTQSESGGRRKSDLPARSSGGSEEKRSVGPSVRASAMEHEVPPLIKSGGPRLTAWVNCYRELLDRWRMWFYRADFDVANKVYLLFDYITTVASTKPITAPSALGLGSAQSPNGSTTTGGDKPSVGTESASALLSSSMSRPSQRTRNISLLTPVNQVFVACGFCGWRLGPQNRPSLSSVGNPTSSTVTVQGTGTSPSDDTIATTTTTSSSRNLQMHGGGGKHTICQRCRKPLPRCSICLMHLGTVALPLTDSNWFTPTREEALKRSAIAAVPSLSENMARVMQLSIIGATGLEVMNNRGDDVKAHATRKRTTSDISTAMASLFIWCQACRHGGHASHLVEWFYGCASSSADVEPHPQCPVSGCQCRCASLDSLRPVAAARVPSRSFDIDLALENEDQPISSTEEEGEESDVDPIGLDDLILQSSSNRVPDPIDGQLHLIKPIDMEISTLTSKSTH
ncbi:hypothetical protein T265_08849 [Opisthorchis viverrini]|uniref:MIOS-like alpha-solenoid domain-containing protein n=3 Tax=Opisthorchis viverrini TaxID=6198 RepID=A0A074Z813_OPIVI|nr:hypothetical protein T265_08849 [Opisthorchis viverrini]KER23238.1 hypothetical protein T265_08849 [Opisthorchis viverrini]